MQNLFVFIFFLSISYAAHSQGKNAGSLKNTLTKPANHQGPVQKYQTSKYAGTYSYGKNDNDTLAGHGIVSIYPETDTTVLFYIDLVRGAPSYNLGNLFGRIIIKNDTGSFETRFDYAEQGCKWTLYFTKVSVTIQTVSGGYECGFGNAVYADGVYKRESFEAPEYFEDPERKVYFSKTNPEDYYKGFYNHPPEVSLSIKNRSKYYIKELTLKNDHSKVYFRDISTDELSEAEDLSSLPDSGWLTVQLLRKRFFKTRLTIIHNRIVLNSLGAKNHKATEGKYILNIDVPKGKKPLLKTTLERQL